VTAIVTLHPVGVRNIGINMSVCLSVCLPTYLKNHMSRYFLYMLPVAAARSSSDDSAIRYGLVLWMTSCFHIMVPMSKNQRWCICFVKFARWRHCERSCCLWLQVCLGKILQRVLADCDNSSAYPMGCVCVCVSCWCIVVKSQMAWVDFWCEGLPQRTATLCPIVGSRSTPG